MSTHEPTAAILTRQPRGRVRRPLHCRLGAVLAALVVGTLLAAVPVGPLAEASHGIPGNIATVAGTGVAGFTGDGGPATSAQIYFPVDVAFDPAGNLYFITDHRVRKVDTAGTITNFAGGPVWGFSGDGGPATAAKLNGPTGLATDSVGNVYISEQFNDRVRKVNTAGIISTVVGTGNWQYNGDGIPATTANIHDPNGLAVDSADNLYISEWGNARIRKVTTAGIISTVAGTGLNGTTGDGGPATSAQIESIADVAVDAVGNFYFAQQSNDRIRKVNTAGIISTVAGTGVGGYNGDGIAATSAQLTDPSGTAVDAAGNLFIADLGNQRIRKVDVAGIITTVAGTGVAGYNGDGIAATSAQTKNAERLAFDAYNNLFIADTNNHRIREVFGVPYPIGGPVLSSELRGHVNPSECWSACHVRGEADPVNPGTGNFSETFTDLAIPGRGVPLAFTRTYNSETAGTDGPLGYGWTHGYNVSLTIAGDESTVTVTQEGASQVTFTKSGSVYTAPPRVTATLVKNGDGTWTLTRRVREILDFDSAGKLTALRDLNGYATTLAYTSGKLSTVTDPAGRTLTFGYSGARITSATDSSTPARTVGFGYDGSGNLTDVTDVGSGNWHFTYDASHRMLTKRDPRTNTVTNHYDAQGRVDWQDDQLGRRTSFDYTSVPDATKVTDPRGNARLYRYVYGMLIAETAGYGTPGAATWSYRHDPATLGVTKVTDPLDRDTLMTYDAQGNRLTLKDALNRQTTWTYNALNQPLTVTDPKNVTTTMTYDAAGNVLTRSRPLKDGSGQTIATQTTIFGYGGTTPVYAGDVTSVTDPNANVTQLRYDAFGDLVKTIAPPTPENTAGNTTTFGYDTAKGWLTSKVSPKGNLTGANPDEHDTLYEHDAFGRVTKIKDPLWSAATPTQHQRVFVYDTNGNLTSETDGNDKTTSYAYNAANELTTTTRADATTLVNTFDKAGNLIAQKDGAGFTTTYGFDALNRLTGTAAYQGVVRSDDPVAWWRLGEASGTTMADSSGNARNGSYNNNGVTYGVVGAVPADANTAVSLNGSSGYASVADNDAFSPQAGANGTITVEGWIKLAALPPAGGENRSAILTKSANNKFEYGLYAYNNGNVGFQLWQLNGTSHSVAVGGSIPLNQWVHVAGTYKNGVATKVYLNGAEVGSSTTFTGTTANSTGAVNIGRRHNGQYLAGSVDEVAIYNVDLTADRVTKHYQGGRGTSFGYDLADNRTSLTDPAGQVTTFGYDVADQLKTISYSDPATPDVTNIDYDADGQRTAMTDGTGTSTWAWDSLNRLTSSTDGAGTTVGYGYDLADQLTSIVYPGSQTLTRHFDAAGRLDWVEDWNTNRTTFGYDVNSNHVSTVFPLATMVTSGSTFDNADRLMAMNVNRSIVPLGSFTYGRDGNDQLSSVTSTGVPLDNHAFTYTPLEQVKNVDAASYGYDSADNLTQLTSGGRQGFDRLNEICWSTTTVPMGTPTCRVPPTGATTYGHDSRGNRTSVTPSGGPTTTLAYDQANRLKAYGANATYVYNGDGLRVSKTVSGATTNFAWDVAQGLPLLLQETTGATTTRYVYGPGGKVIAKVNGTTTTYHHADQLGSTRLLTDDAGTVVGTFTFDAFGKLTGSTGSATTPFGFAGEYTDAETGFQYLRARSYDPATGQFLTRDPMEPITGSPYAYANNDPLNFTDPSGECPWCLIPAVIVIGGITAPYVGAVIAGPKADAELQRREQRARAHTAEQCAPGKPSPSSTQSSQERASGPPLRSWSGLLFDTGPFFNFQTQASQGGGPVDPTNRTPLRPATGWPMPWRLR